MCPAQSTRVILELSKHSSAVNCRPPIRVLIADDDRAVLGVLNSVVRFLGHLVVGTAVNTKECLRKVVETQPNLVLLDLSISGANGLETAELISKNVPVIITTGLINDEILERLEQSTVAGHLAKPFKLESVKAVLESATEDSRGDQHTE